MGKKKVFDILTTTFLIFALVLGAVSFFFIVTPMTESNINKFPEITEDISGNIYVAWYKNHEIVYNFRSSTTNNWGFEERVFIENLEYAVSLSIITDIEGDIHLVWYDDTTYGGSGNDTDIFYRQWKNETEPLLLRIILTFQSFAIQN